MEKTRSTAPYGYLNKPVSKRDLMTNIDSAFYRHELEKKLKMSQEEILHLNRELINSQEKERRRIASDLHDSVVQTLLAAKINIEKSFNAPQTSNAYELGIQFIDRAVEELRTIYSDLYPTILRDIGLEATIRWYANNYLEVGGIAVVLDISIEGEIPENIKIHLYRIVQEIFSNIIRHSGADSVEVHLTYRTENDFFLKVHDNGIGFSKQEDLKYGYGLRNIKQRATMIDCFCKVSGKPDEGVAILIKKEVV